jgi:5'-nucleotidase
MEGCALGIASVALSQAGDEETRETIDWTPGEIHGPGLIRQLLKAGWPDSVLMNVNFPHASAAEVKGWALVPQGRYDLQSTEIEERHDARSRAYYWIGLRRRRASPPEGTDLGAVARGKISVTPLHMNLTEAAALQKMQEKLGRNPGFSPAGNLKNPFQS